MFKNDTKSYILLTALIASLMVVSLVLTPVLGGLVRLVVSALLGVTVAKYHYKFVIGTSCIVLAISVLLGGLASILTTGLTVLLFGLSIGLGLNLRLPLYRVVVIAAVTYLAANMALVWVANAQMDGEFMSGIILQITDEAYRTMEQVYKPVMSPEQLEQLKAMVNQIGTLMITLLPSMLISAALLFAYVAVAVAKRFLIKSGKDMSYLLGFADVRGDRVLAIIFAAVLLLYVAGISQLVSDVLLNVICVILFLFYVYGLTLVDWFMRWRGFRKLTRVLTLVAVYIAAFLFAFLPVLAVVGAGLADSVFDFRRRMRSNGMTL